MKIYFAGSIRAGRHDRELYKQIIKLLRQYGRVLTEHVGYKNVSRFESKFSEKEIHDRDLKLLGQSDVVVAEVTTPSLGVGYEIAKAKDLDKTILCIFRKLENKTLSAMITGSRNIELKEYNELEEVEAIFSKFFSKYLKTRRIIADFYHTIN
jgi:hypothetical protein